MIVLAGPFINADLIQRDELRDFVKETVFSHPSKLELIDEAKARGYTVIVMHVGVDTAALSVARVGARVGDGGHAVPPDKIAARYERGAPLIRQAVLLADRGMVFDNSRLNRPPAHCLTCSRGRLTFARPHVPEWVRAVYDAELVRYAGMCDDPGLRGMIRPEMSCGAP